MKTLTMLCALMTFVVANSSHAADKTFIDYFLRMPIESPLVSDVWGDPGVSPRDPKNGLEDEAMKQWNYWDGQIIKGPNGKYHLFASRWDQAEGHRGWWGSLAVHAVSDKVTGPYVDKGLCWPDNQGGKGHNVTALVLPDGRYAVVVSETRPGDVFVSDSLDGPWEHLGSIKVAENEFSRLGRMSNVSIMVRPDGDFMIVPRSGAILISKDGILGPYVVQGPSVYPSVDGLPLRNLEDPVVWHSGGLYHIVVNGWSDRKAYHITSVDGITDWTLRGLAYDPTTDFARYSDGTVNHWYKLEHPGVVIENGHVTALSLAVLDVPKRQERGTESSDGGATWTYKGTADISYGKDTHPNDYTYWAPEVIWADGTYHMFLSFVPGIFDDWNHPREIVHLTSKDGVKWDTIGPIDLKSDRVIDACVVQLPSGTWRMWYKDERGTNTISYADSPDLMTWQAKGNAVTDYNGEGSKVMHWKGKYWLISDCWRNGQRVWTSDDCLNWTPQDGLLIGSHGDAVVSGDRAWWFYFSGRRRAEIDVVELSVVDGKLVAGDPTQPTYIDLKLEREQEN